MTNNILIKQFVFGGNMKKIFIYLMAAICLFTNLFSINHELDSPNKLLALKGQVKKEWNLPDLNFEELAKSASSNQNLLNHIDVQPKEMTSPCKEMGRYFQQKSLVIVPITQGILYVNGVLCHVGNYARTVLITVLEGPQFGLQTTMNYRGRVLACNFVCYLDNTPDGVLLRHEYYDSTVITGTTQVIILH